MNNLIISKDNIWTNHLITLLKGLNIKWLQTTDINEIKKYNPDWIFFFHWSNIVPAEIYTNFNCVVIHTGNLPQGRGGSPLQNQIMSGITSSKVNAIQMTNILDGGGVYDSLPITLQGTITDIWLSIAEVSNKLIRNIINTNPTPKIQEGKIQTYKRRTNNQLNFQVESLQQIYNQIRMLDSEDYPSIYLEVGDYKLEFSRSQLLNEKILTDVTITKK